MEALLGDMANMPIVKTEVKSGGTQLKLIITFAGNTGRWGGGGFQGALKEGSGGLEKERGFGDGGGDGRFIDGGVPKRRPGGSEKGAVEAVKGL